MLTAYVCTVNYVLLFKRITVYHVRIKINNTQSFFNQMYIQKKYRRKLYTPRVVESFKVIVCNCKLHRFHIDAFHALYPFNLILGSHRLEK